MQLHHYRRQLNLLGLLVIGGIMEMCYTLQPIWLSLSSGRCKRLMVSMNDNGLVTKKVDSQLTNMLESLPKSEKYSLLIQSIASSIMENNDKLNVTEFDTITGLYQEMIQANVKPTPRSSQQLINVACKFCSCDFVAQAMGLVRAQGDNKCYGLGNGVLSPVEVKNALQVQVPSDNREEEVSSALAIASIVSLYVTLQVAGSVNGDLHPWATLVGSVGALVTVGDAIFRKGQFLRAAVQGIERLTVQDEEREEFLDASGFVMGYLLGLPCFAFQPDVTEALKMIRESPASMEGYKISGDKRELFSSFKSRSAMTPYSPGNDDYLEGLGRVLVWLMAPIAAEVILTLF